MISKIFYHFTYPEHLDAILREGLLPADGSASDSADLLFGHKACWLTAVPTLVPTRRAREIYLRRAIWFKTTSSNLPYATVCLQVRLPTHDRKLKKVVPWLRKRLPIDREDAVLHESDWLYFGVVKPEWLTLHKHVPPAEPHYSLPPHIVAAYRAGATLNIDEATVAYFLDYDDEAAA